MAMAAPNDCMAKINPPPSVPQGPWRSDFVELFQELCEPCTHLQQLTGKPMIKTLLHRGGLRAEILSGGNIRVGDRITEAS
jgi:hypothetical protein